MGVLCHVSTRQLVDTCRPQREKCCVMYSSSILVSLLLLAKQLQFPHGVSIVPSHIASQKISFDLEPDGLHGFIRKPFSQTIQTIQHNNTPKPVRKMEDNVPLISKTQRTDKTRKRKLKWTYIITTNEKLGDTHRADVPNQTIPTRTWKYIITRSEKLPAIKRKSAGSSTIRSMKSTIAGPLHPIVPVRISTRRSFKQQFVREPHNASRIISH